MVQKKQETESQLLSVSRKEIKYMVSLPDRLFLLDALNQLLIPDAYGGYNGYTVRSVYFDGISNEDYLAKIQHQDEKKRIRLRVYTPDDKKAKFEIKRKSYGRELKESIVITKEDALKLLEGDYQVLSHYNHPMASYARDFMSARLYRPVSMIEYDRRAYTHPCFNTRITLDNNLRYCLFHYDLFGHGVNFYSAMPKDKTILEIKYDRFLFKQIQDVLSSCDLSQPPPSKFKTSRAILDQYYC